VNRGSLVILILVFALFLTPISYNSGQRNEDNWQFRNNKGEVFNETQTRTFTTNDNELLHLAEIDTSRPFPTTLVSESTGNASFSSLTNEGVGPLYTSETGLIPVFHNRSVTLDFELDILHFNNFYSIDYSIEGLPNWNINGDLSTVLTSKAANEFHTSYGFHHDIYQIDVEQKYNVQYIGGDNFTMTIYDYIITMSLLAGNASLEGTDIIYQFLFRAETNQLMYSINGTVVEQFINATSVLEGFSYEFTLANDSKIPSVIRQTEVVKGVGLSLQEADTVINEYHLITEEESSTEMTTTSPAGSESSSDSDSSSPPGEESSGSTETYFLVLPMLIAIVLIRLRSSKKNR
jgi:hypothetical protein